MSLQNIAATPVSVNYFLSRDCNYHCSYCFHTPTTSFILDLDDAKRGMFLLRNSGMRKITFTGGEPFLHAYTRLGPLAEYCKFDLGLECVSVISNGSLIDKQWMNRYAKAIDILGLSCDSFFESTNRILGRGDGSIVRRVYQLAVLCRDLRIQFKLNTVVNAKNWQEDMNIELTRIKPFRWKCFQLLLIAGENSGGDVDLKDARPLAITNAQFASFLERHKSQPSLIAEDNENMRTSYLLLDENMRFLNCSGGQKQPTKSILEVGVLSAMQESGFDVDLFLRRGGLCELNAAKSHYRTGNDDQC